MKWFEKIRERRMELGLSQAELARKVRMSQASIDKIERGRVERPRKLPDLVAVLGIDPKDIEAGGAEWFGLVAPAYQPGPPVHSVPSGSIPVFAADAEFVALPAPLDRAIEFIPASPGIPALPDAYALMVVSDEMFPAYRAGDIILINPRLPPIRGTDVAVYARAHGKQSYSAIIARFERPRQDAYVLHQYNRPNEDEEDEADDMRPLMGLTFPVLKANVIAVHRVVARIIR
ncbi:MAG: helix-turn-helix domain-containing protein [Chelatococcus sp.]|nr:helix-turn-helix domain-containing protein [Chelatococcus sp. HY11]MBX3544515.1 helix-turn-helix domain-containing protein [Chelatococcus sp.]